MIEGWTSKFTSRHVAYMLQAAGVAAAPVHDNAGLLMDPQLESREYYITRPSTRFGIGMFSRIPPLFQRTPALHERAGEALGEESAEVLEEWAGITEDESELLVKAGVLFPAEDLDRVYTRPYIKWFRYFAPTLGWPALDD